jgi:hypothetical protein
VTIETYTRAMMVRIAVEEGQRHGGVNNMLAILHVLRNRVMAGWGDWQEVAETAESRRGNIYPPTKPNMRSNDVRVVLNRVDEIYTRADTTDLVGGALFYVDQNFPIEEWFTREIIGHPDEHKRVAHIGPVWFFT